MATVINGIVSLTVTAIVFAQVLMPTLVTGINSTYCTAYNATGSCVSLYTTDSSALSLWSTTQVIAVVGFVLLILAVYGI